MGFLMTRRAEGDQILDCVIAQLAPPSKPRKHRFPVLLNAPRAQRSLRTDHRRDIPRTLRKKLERIIWKPSVKHKRPGITIRRVLSGSSGPNARIRQ
jgi:hypothetical protein